VIPQSISLPSFADWNGTLFVAENQDLPFDIARVFFITAPRGSRRGGHAHKTCHQLLICCSGAIAVTTESVSSIKTETLLTVGESLYVPPMIWASQLFELDQTVLLVLCSETFNENEYIRDKATFAET
jgi:dTDP-4-dehydrorhamnose 3,5-epimerase-like enzyme